MATLVLKEKLMSWKFIFTNVLGLAGLLTAGAAMRIDSTPLLVLGATSIHAGIILAYAAGWRDAQKMIAKYLPKPPVYNFIAETTKPARKRGW